MTSPAVSTFLLRACVAAALLASNGVGAATSDRSQPMVVEADRDGVVDLQRQVLVYSGNVVISQGTMVLRAERVETRELPNGYRTASAIGQSGKQATWRQRRDGVDETVEGSADRIDYDGRADTLRFVGNAAVRRLRGSAIADEITGANIVWDNTAEVFRVEGGNKTAANPTGRVRAVLSPQPAASAASGPAPAAPLAPSRSLGEPR